MESNFKELKFNEKLHQYKVGNLKLKSVSKLLENFVFKPDFDKIAEYISIRDNIDKKELLQQWEDKKNKACEKGTITHNYAELEDRDPISNSEIAAYKFLSDLKFKSNYKIVSKELRMYHKDKLFAGTSDLIIYNSNTNSYIIADYKTNADLFKQYKDQKLLSPFQKCNDNPFSKYEIQLSFYQIMAEQIEEVNVTERWIIWLKEDQTYALYKGKDRTKELNDWLLNFKDFTY